MQYYFREGLGKKVQLAKFDDDHPEPIEIYLIVGNTCTCPSPRYPCKHIRMRNEWLSYQQERYHYHFDDVLNKFVRHEY